MAAPCEIRFVCGGGYFAPEGCFTSLSSCIEKREGKAEKSVFAAPHSRFFCLCADSLAFVEKRRVFSLFKRKKIYDLTFFVHNSVV